MFTDLRQSTKWLGIYMLCAALLLVMRETAEVKVKDAIPSSATTPELVAQTAAAPASNTVTKAVAMPSDQIDYQKVEVTATGYTAGPESTGKDVGHPEYGITYSGVKVRRAHVSTIAADPKVFPIGSLLYIPDYGYGIVADTGSAIKGNKIDLFFETKEQVYDLWGKKDVQVLLIYKGNGSLSEHTVNELNETVSQKGHLLDVAS